MRRGLLIIVIGILLLVVTVVAAFGLGLIGGNGDGGPAALPENGTPGKPQPTAVPLTQEIIIAVQDIPRGFELTVDAVDIAEYPVDSIPEGAIVGSREQDRNENGMPDVIEDMIGRRLRVSVRRFDPILSTMVTDPVGLSGKGSDAALDVPAGRVLVAFPLPSSEENPTTAVAYALRPGDHVDMMVSLSLVDLDSEFHTKLPNNNIVLNVFEEGEGGGVSGSIIEFTAGRVENGPLGLIFNVVPSEFEQRPRPVTQLTVQDMVVVRVGRYPTYPEEIRGIDPHAPPTPTPVPDTGGAEGEQPQQQAPPPPPPEPTVVVLAVTPQDALVLSFAQRVNANVDFALRAVGDQALFQTNAVTLEYLIETYNISVPPKLEFGIDSPTNLGVESLFGAP
jgi:pilus assembly protein CpaB